MFSKFLCLALLAITVSGQDHGHHGHHQAISSQSISRHDTPVHHGHEQHGHDDHHHEEHYAHPKYEFEYKVEDLHTKDIKGQHEARDGDKVHGHYYLHQPDGHIRHVDYHADKHDGFHADVKFNTKHESHHHH